MSGRSYLRRAVENLRHQNTVAVQPEQVPIATAMNTTNTVEDDLRELNKNNNGSICNGNVTVDPALDNNTQLSAMALRDMYMSTSEPPAEAYVPAPVQAPVPAMQLPTTTNNDSNDMTNTESVRAECTPSPHDTDHEEEAAPNAAQDDSYIIVEEDNAGTAEDEGDVQTFYLCPICRSMVFPTLEEVETHQETCDGEEEEGAEDAQQQMTTLMEEEQQENPCDTTAGTTTTYSTSTNVGNSNTNFMPDQKSIAVNPHTETVTEATNMIPTFIPQDNCINAPMIDHKQNHPQTTTFDPDNALTGTIPLGLPEDSAHLIPLHCFVRKYCLHIFSANTADAHGRKIGKGKPITVGQVGICCPHCISILPRCQARGAIYFPSNISQIYSAALNLLQRHIYSCVTMPHELKEMYERLKSDEGRSGRSKHYWVESAKKLGLVDTQEGIRYDPPHLASAEVPERENHQPRNELLEKKQLVLVLPEDKEFTTDYAMFLFQQMERCSFSESDKIGKRRGCVIGFSGLACKHCSARCGLGRLFPTSFKSFADTSKTMDKMHIHLLRCRDCPIEIKSALIRMKHEHDTQKTKLKFGLMKAFHLRVWARLHGLDEASIVDGRNIQAAMGLSALSR